MMPTMKFYLAVLLTVPSLIFFTSMASAFEAVPVSPRIPYDAITIDSRIATLRSYLGELTGDPHMYEFTIGESQTLALKIKQKDGELLPLSVIIVKARDNDRGVREIGRVSGQASTSWQSVYDGGLGIPLVEGETFTADLEAGVYRVEVSTPENIGKYLLAIGKEDSEAGYFASVAAVYRTQHFFDYSPFRILSSSYIYYPIGIVVLVTLIFFTWRYRQKISHA
jgi:hypothetical protein